MSAAAAWLLPTLTGLALTAWVGAVTASAACPALARHSRALRLALGYGVGMGVTAGLLFVLGVLGVRFGAGVVVGAQVAVAIGLAWVAALRSLPVGPGMAGAWRTALFPFAQAVEYEAGAALRASSSAEAAAAPDVAARRAREASPGATRSPLAWAVLVAIALVVLVVALLSVADGASFIDARTIWMVKARAFFLDRGFDGGYFTDWPEVLDRRSYPLLYPLYGTYLHLLCGSVQDGALKLGQVATLAALLVLVHHVLRRVTGALTSAGATLLFALCGPAVTLTVWGNADLDLALYALGALWALDRTCQGESEAGAPRAYLALAGLLLACAVFTKLEGVLVLASLAVAYAVAVRPWRSSGTDARPDAARRHSRHANARPDATSSLDTPRRARLGGLLRLVFPALVVAGAWLAFCASRGLGHYMAHTETLETVSSDAGLLSQRLGLVAGRLLDQMLSERWLYAWPLFALALVVSWRARNWSPLAVVPVFVVVQLAAYFAVFVLLSKHVEWHMQTAMSRLLFHVFPAVWVYTVTRLAAPAPRVATPASPVEDTGGR